MNNNLKRLRERLGMNQKEFAASMGIGHTTYNGYETGARDPKSDFWIAVSEKYSVSIDYLLRRADDSEIIGGIEMTFRIREARERAGLTQEELATKLGVKANTLHGYEAGKHDPKSETLAQISKICGVTVDYLLGLENDDGTISDEKPANSTRSELIELVINLSDDEAEYILGLVQRLLHIKP